MALIAEALAATSGPFATTGPNDLAAIACFTRAYHQIRASVNLLTFGHYSEVPTVLRAAYESAGLGRYLAKQADKAERWLKREDEWFPDRAVRDWFGDEDASFAHYYQFLSRLAHPTAPPSLAFMVDHGDHHHPRLDIEFDEARFRGTFALVITSVLWTCFAIRNAAAGEDRLPVPWRRELADLAAEVIPGGDWSHLERDWEAEQARWDDVMGRIQSAEGIERLIEDSPMSARNLRRAAEPGE